MSCGDEISNDVLRVDQEGTHVNHVANFVPERHVPVRLESIVDQGIGLHLSHEELSDSHLVKTLDENNNSHIDVLLGKDLSEACCLLLNFGVFLLELTKLLEKVGNDFIDENSARGNKKQGK